VRTNFDFFSTRLPKPFYGIDLEQRCTFRNPACLRTLGYEHIDKVLGKNMHNLLHHTRADGTLFRAEECRVHRVMQSGEGVHAEDEVFWRANGTSFPVEYWSYPQRRGNAVVGAGRDRDPPIQH
jgi:two-component system cell cycle sensor histidine kinase/response regulator CckA